MKIVKKISIILGIVILIIAVGSLWYINSLKKKGLPDYNQNVALKGLKDEVAVYRDKYGIPHVYAKNAEDLYRVVGYLSAQDRFWQMDLLRRVTTGRLSEIFGKDMVESDYLLRALRFSEKSEELLKEMPPDVLKELDAYTDGINQYIEQNKNNLPFEFTVLGYKPEPWTNIHSLNLIGYMAWDLGTGWSNEITLFKLKNKLDSVRFNQLFADFDRHNTVVYSDFYLDSLKTDIAAIFDDLNTKLEDIGATVFNGSNNWAVSGKKSVTGKPILANDMHLGLNIPGIWYQIHQVVDGELNVTGLMIPGAPYIVAGHNDSIAWGMTNIMLDDMDFYIDKINPDNPNQYKYDGQWKDFVVKEEKIATKEGDTITKVIKFTHRGPVISDIKNLEQVVDFHWIGNEWSNEMVGVRKLNRANNIDDYFDAAKLFKAVSQNLIYADLKGNIAIYAAGNVPVRNYDGAQIVPGDTSFYEWKGFVPFDSLPHSVNPERGFVSSANNKSAPDGYPYYISHWFYQPYRIDRINEMLTQKDKLSADDFKKMQADWKSKLVEYTLSDMLFAISSQEYDNEVAKEAEKILANWDGVLSRDSKAALIYETFYVFMLKQLVNDELGDELTDELLKKKLICNNLMENVLADKQSPWYDDVTTKDKKETIDDVVKMAFDKTINYLLENYGNIENWTWSKAHTITLKHPLGKVNILDKLFDLNRGPIGIGGSNHTVSPYSYPYNDMYNVNHGASHRHIFTLDDWDKSQTVIPTGESGIPASPHYCDQTDMYLSNVYHEDFFSKDLVVKNAKYRNKFTPVK